VAVRNPNPSMLRASWAGVPLFCADPEHSIRLQQAGLHLQGQLSDLLAAADVIVDCTQRGEGAHRLATYASASVPAIFQGGEQYQIAGLTFSSFVNYEAAFGRRAVRIASCVTTGLARLLALLNARWVVRQAYAALVRCATDPDKAAKGAVNGASVVEGYSHHMHELHLLFGEMQIHTQAISVPMTPGHIAMLAISLRGKVSREEIVDILRQTPRILVEGRTGPTSQLMERYATEGRPRGDRPELMVWENSVCVSDDFVHLQACIHMESIVIPENIDCIRAMLCGVEREASIQQTDQALGIAKPPESYRMIPGRAALARGEAG